MKVSLFICFVKLISEWDPIENWTIILDYFDWINNNVILMLIIYAIINNEELVILICVLILAQLSL